MSAILVSCVLNFSVITLLPEDVRISVIILDDVDICTKIHKIVLQPQILSLDGCPVKGNTFDNKLHHSISYV